MFYFPISHMRFFQGSLFSFIYHMYFFFSDDFFNKRKKFFHHQKGLIWEKEKVVTQCMQIWRAMHTLPSMARWEVVLEHGSVGGARAFNITRILQEDLYAYNKALWL